MAGDAKDIIMKNRDVRIQIPTMADREGPEGPLLYVFEGDEDGRLGKAMFTKEVEKVPARRLQLRKDKQGLISELLMHLSSGMETKVRANPEFQAAVETDNLLKIWQILEFTATGQGAHSIGVDLSALLKLKQKGHEFPKYLTSFRDRVAAIMRSGKTAAQLWAIMLNVIFILGLSQEQFGRQLDEVYSKEEWPHYDTLAAELLRHSTVTDSLERMTKDNPDGIVTANVATASRPATAGGERCHNCDREGHRRSDCPEKPSKCQGCGETGHMQKYCAIVQRYTKSRAKSASGQGRRGGTHEKKKGKQPTSKLDARFKKAAAMAAEISETIEELQHQLGDEHEELYSQGEDDDDEDGEASDWLCSMRASASAQE